MLAFGYNIIVKLLAYLFHLKEYIVGVNQKLLEYHIGRLKDKRVEVRLQSIQELVLLNDIGALDALRDVFTNDSDVEVRKAAQEAGRVIFKNQASNSTG
ncbi:MAG: hypothetical protein CUN52_06005 [Phototrophicales bacterium]|nr:MAG: hypothetical protein CUN52_06005 [Phototrophicales bacterium]